MSQENLVRQASFGLPPPAPKGTELDMRFPQTMPESSIGSWTPSGELDISRLKC